MYILRLFVLFLLLTIEGRGNTSDPCVCINQKEKQSFLKRIARLEEVRRLGDCPIGFIRYSRYCYLFMLGTKSRSNWADAKEYCREKGANLVTIDGHRQEAFITNYFMSNFKNEAEEIKMFTGLIYTDQSSLFPYDPTNAGHSDRSTSSQGDSVRWTATQAAVNYSKDGVYPSQGPLAKWSPPNIQGYYYGPGSKYLSCVILKWEVGKGFLWRFNSCWDEELQFICEVRLRKHKKRKSSRRQKRDTSDDLSFSEYEEDEEDEDPQ